MQAKKTKKCIFCLYSKTHGSNKNINKHVVFQTKHSQCVLNIYPYNNGHLMVAPLCHVRDFSMLDDAQLLDLMRSVEKARALLKEALSPDGFNIGVNMSRTAGAGIPGHLHVHIVPRWNGDTNFMPIIGNTKVISQSLVELHKTLRHAYTKTNARSGR